MSERIGVYICHCGTNISQNIDVEVLAEHARTLPGVETVKEYKYMCSNPGQDLIKKDIEEKGLTRVVVSSCSPLMHEETFRNVCEDAGLNRFLFQMSNIREQCSWVHSDREKATEKAKRLITAAVRRVEQHLPVEKREVPVRPETLVVGAGIAGIEAALRIADSGKKVYLVEKESSIGGHMAKFDKTFPTLDCAACILTPKMVSVGQHPNIELLSYSEVEELSGFVGNFKVTIRRKPRYVDEEKCNGCGSCVEVCPVEIPNEFDEGMSVRKAIYREHPQAMPNTFLITKGEGENVCIECMECVKVCEARAIKHRMKEQVVELEVGAIVIATGFELFDSTQIARYGYGRLENVISALEFERLSHASGPTGGKVLKADGTPPKAVAILHCIGSRDENFQKHCSRVCCMYSLKFAHLIKEKTDAEVYNLYIDMRAFGKGYEEFYKRLLREDVHFIRGKAAEVTEAAQSPEEEGRLIVVCEDTLLGITRRIPVDMVILSAGLKPARGADGVARVFSIGRSPDGFFLERHPKLAPVDTASDGIFLAGACQGPKDIPDSVAQGGAAAAAALSLIDRGAVEIEPIKAEINEDLCGACKLCIANCPYSAIDFDEEKKVSVVTKELCKGCGTCVAGCPSGAARQQNFDDNQILAEMAGILAA